MTADEELRILRERVADQAAELDRLEALAGGQGAAPMLVKTRTVGAYPTSAGAYYAVSAVDPGGAETEGGAATFADITGTFYALNVGAGIPDSGTRVVVEPIAGRWVFEFNS